MFERLPGFRDFYPAPCAARNHVFGVWRETARRFSFAEYDAPVLEPLGLFTAKSGEEITGQLFNFTDKGGREVALRPEMTPSLMRLAGAKINSLKRPVKWFCVAEMFRYEKPQKGRTRSHYQFNADVLGESGPAADAEILSLLAQTFQSFGLTERDVVLRLSDRDLWLCYLYGKGLDEGRAMGVLSVIDKLERESREETLEKLREYFDRDAEDILKDAEAFAGLRSVKEMRDFLLRQIFRSDMREKLEARLAEWECLLALLEAMGVLPFVRIDPGIVRGLAYYTGFVFEAFEKGGKGRALAGGGRYDHLAAKLGYPDLSASGFGMGDVTLTGLLEDKKRLPPLGNIPDLYLVIGGPEERKAALRDISRLRQEGYSVEYAFKEAGFGRQFKLADASGAPLALIYGAEEVRSGQVKARGMASGKEFLLPRDNLLPALRERAAGEMRVPRVPCSKRS